MTGRGGVQSGLTEDDEADSRGGSSAFAKGGKGKAKKVYRGWKVDHTEMLRAKRGGNGEMRSYTFLRCPYKCGHLIEVLTDNLSSRLHTTATEHLTKCPMYAKLGMPRVIGKNEKARRRLEQQMRKALSATGDAKKKSSSKRAKKTNNKPRKR